MPPREVAGPFGPQIVPVGIAAVPGPRRGFPGVGASDLIQGFQVPVSEGGPGIGAVSMRLSTVASEVSFPASLPQPLRDQPCLDSHLGSWAAAVAANLAKPCRSRTDSHRAA